MLNQTTALRQAAPLRSPVEEEGTRARFSGAERAFFDALRILASNLVLLSHVSLLFRFDPPLRLGSLGVVLFFLLSGYLICVAAARRWGRQGDQFLDFLIDRWSRIFVPFLPALLIVAALVELFALRNYGQFGVDRGPIALLANALLLHDYPLCRAVARFATVEAYCPRAYHAAGPFWTIPLEFWTYVTFGGFVFFLLRKEAALRWMAALLCAVALPVFLWNSFGGSGTSLSLVWLFGALAGLCRLQFSRFERLCRVGIALVMVGSVGLVARGIKPGYNVYEFQQATFVGCVVVGVSFLLCRIADVPRLLGRALLALAAYSYSLYLTHFVSLVLVKELLAERLGQFAPAVSFILAHLVAIGFYAAFERHYRVVARRIKRRLVGQDSSP